MKKLLTIIFALLLVVGIPFTLAGCDNDDTQNNYNIILTKATMPSLLAGMDSVASEDNSYAYIERGATYSGIADVEKFTNKGFDATSNANTIDSSKVTLMSQSIEQIIDRDEEATFTIYVTDYDALTGWAIAYGAGLTDEQFKVVMVEDGSGMYAAFKNAYITGKDAITAYNAFLATVESAKQAVAAVKLDPTEYAWGNYPMCFGLATLPTGCLRLQDAGILKSSIDENSALVGSKLYDSINKNYRGSNVKMNMKVGTAGDTCAALTTSQFSSYLTLALGTTNQTVTEALLRRTHVGETAVNSNKLIFCGTRSNGYNFGLVGDIANTNELISYTDLATGTDVQKFIYGMFTETDYNAVIAALNANVNGTYTTEQKEQQKVAAFNLYAEYKNALKLTVDIYGSSFDILYKGHPSESVNGDGSDWQASKYPLSGGLSYEKIMFALVNYFHTSDAIGSKIGVLPGKVSIDTFAYLGIDFAIGGLKSSTYSSYPTYVPTEFILASDTLNIASYNMTGTRYLAGTMFDTDNKVTTYWNRGSLLQYLNKDEELKTWIETTFGVADGTNYGITKGGFLGVYSSDPTPVLNAVSRNIVYHYEDLTTANATKAVKNGDIPSSYAVENPTRTNYTFGGWYTSNSTFDSTTKFTPSVYNNASVETINVYAQWIAA